jgi:hypothetical protein
VLGVVFALYAEAAGATRRKRDGEPNDSDSNPTPKQSEQETDGCPSRIDDLLENAEVRVW